MKIDFQESLNALPQLLTLERWTEMTHSEAVNKAVADFQHGDAAAKKRLPAITWQAFFAGKRRSNANAIPSGSTCSTSTILRATPHRFSPSASCPMCASAASCSSTRRRRDTASVSWPACSAPSPSRPSASSSSGWPRNWASRRKKWTSARKTWLASRLCPLSPTSTII